jgi:hypothetical protein
MLTISIAKLRAVKAGVLTQLGHMSRLFERAGVEAHGSSASRDLQHESHGRSCEKL